MNSRSVAPILSACSLQAAGLALVVGGLAGSASALFLWLLDLATAAQWSHSWLLWTLPVVGLLVGWFYEAHGRGVGRGNNFLLEEIHHPREAVPLRMVPFVLLGTVLTHLAGGSAGREGTAVQMGGSLGDAVSRCFGVDAGVRRLLLFAGIAGGFGAVFGTPLAGAVFAMEVVVISRLQWSACFPVLVASFAGHYVCTAWGIHHTNYESLVDANVELSQVPLLQWGQYILLGIVCGVVAQGFARLTRGIQIVGTKLFKWAPWRPFAGGLLIVALAFLLNTRDFLGLGVTNPNPDGVSILAAFNESGYSSWAWFWKLVFTAITIGSGFKGGEVTPLFFIGAALGHTTGLTLHAPVPLFAALGLVAVFAGAAKTPLASAVMAGELFGWHLLVPAAITCEVAFLASGRAGIYSSQRRPDVWVSFP